MRDRTFSRREMLWAGGALAVGAAFAEPFKATAAEPTAAGPEPTSWVDSAMPDVSHRMIETNGIRLHVAEQGKGPLIILCHGFPECWYSWRHQLPALANAGFRAVAPDLRGYGLSDRPGEVEKYTILDDIGDIVGLVDALGAKQAVIAGHDIGAAIAWQTALLRPGIFRAVIALSPPFRSRGFGDAGPPTTLMPRTENAVFYQLFLRTPEAEAGLGRDLRLTFRYQFSTFSGDRPPSAGVGGLPPGMMPRKGGFLIDPPSLPAWVTDSDIDVYVKEYARSGFHGPLAWWRNIDRGWELMAPFAGAAVTVPALYMAGERDFVAAVFSQDIAKQSALVPKLRPPIMLPGCGHWTQQERAAEVSTAMIDFLRSLQAEDENARWVPICVSSVSSFAKGQPSAVSPCVAGSKPGRGGATPVNVRQKQTLGKVRLMSALPPKADIASGTLRIEHRASLRVAVTESSRASIALTTLSLAGLSPCRCAVS